MIDALVACAGWQSRASPDPEAHRDGVLKGCGFVYVRCFHSRSPGSGAAWVAWVVDIEVNPENGVVRAAKVQITYDRGQMANPDGVGHQIHGSVIRSTSRAPKEFATFDRRGITSLERDSYLILGFLELSGTDVLLLDHSERPPMGVGESVLVLSVVAIANAIFDATRARPRQVPFTLERILMALCNAQVRPPFPGRRGAPRSE